VPFGTAGVIERGRPRRPSRPCASRLRQTILAGMLCRRRAEPECVLSMGERLRHLFDQVASLATA